MEHLQTRSDLPDGHFFQANGSDKPSIADHHNSFVNYSRSSILIMR